jgi:hypothetical protein
MIWKKKKCPVCQDKYSEKTPFHELRLETADGTHVMEICENCADFFDKSADVIMKGRKDESLRLRELDQYDQEEPDERYGE